MNPATYFFVFLFSTLLSLILVRAAIMVCQRYSLYDYPGRHKRHKEPTPNLGGTAIFIVIWIVMAGLLLVEGSTFSDIKGSLVHIFIGSFIVLLTGIIDDLKALPAWPKLVVQALAGVILYLGGLSINLLSVPGIGTIQMGWLNIIITVIWVVSLSNAINLIDGLDGLAAGVSAIAAATMAVIGVLFQIDSVILISLILLGALISFWFYNRHPARIFLGDCGSLLIGFFFAVISLVVPIKSFTAAALFLPLLVLGVPLTETLTSFLRRLAAGKNVMKADRRHIFHYLGHAGLSQKQIVALFYLSGVVFSAISLTMFFFERTLVLGFLLLFMVVIFILYLIFMSKIMKG